jgi:hypothetical protein
MTKDDARRIWRIKEANKALRGLPDAAVFIMILDQEVRALEQIARRRAKRKE